MLSALLVVFVAPPARPTPTPERCFGKVVTIVGTNDDDVIDGTGSHDVIAGLGGDDRIDGLDGNDILCGNAGDDHIEDGDGLDIVSGAEGDDWLYGNYVLPGPGDDTVGGVTLSFEKSMKGVEVHTRYGRGIARGQGHDILLATCCDVLIGSVHDDKLFGNGFDNVLVGLGGDDVLVGGGGTDSLAYRHATGVRVDLRAGNSQGQGRDAVRTVEDVEGTPGSDVILGSRGPNSLNGGLRGHDRILGRGGDDSLFPGGRSLVMGGRGDDYLLDSDCDCLLKGGRGDDKFISRGGKDVIRGGEGTDMLSFRDFSRLDRRPVQVSMRDKTSRGRGRDEILGLENITGTYADDVLVGDGGANSINGSAGDDRLVGLRGGDHLAGRSGADRLRGQKGDDVLQGGFDNDMLFGGAGADSLNDGFLTRGRDVLRGGPGGDILGIPEPDNRAYGGAGRDRFWTSDSATDSLLDGGDGVDEVSLAASKSPANVDLKEGVVELGKAIIEVVGIEWVAGTDLDDVLSGDVEDNRILAGSGNDRLDGREGQDELDGQEGTDICLNGETTRGCESPTRGR